MNPTHSHTQFDAIFRKKIFFLDGDGTLYVGNKLLPGAKTLLQRLSAASIPYYICTNNSSKPPQDYLNHYNKIGLPVLKSNILTSTQPAIFYLKEQHILNAYIIATKSVHRYIASLGIQHDETDPQALLLTYDTELTYKEITHTVKWLNKGIPYFATHPDQLCPSENGMLPDIGTYITMFKTASGRTPDLIFGKPSTMMIEPILKKHQLSLGDSVIIGDRLYTDIKMGAHNPLTTVLTLQGETTIEMANASSIKADYIITSLEQIT